MCGWHAEPTGTNRTSGGTTDRGPREVLSTIGKLCTVCTGASPGVSQFVVWSLSLSFYTEMGHGDSITDSMTHQTKKKRIEDQSLPSDAGQRPIQLQRRRVWRACESCRCISDSYLSIDWYPCSPSTLLRSRKKIKCDGNEPTCSQCTTSGSQCTWLQTKDRAALSRQYVLIEASNAIHISLSNICLPSLVMFRSSKLAFSTWNPSLAR
jgi:hypothetical protein